MMDYSVKIGLVPMRRDVCQRPGIFNWDKAIERGHRFVSFIEKTYADDQVSFVDLNGLNSEDLLFSEKDVPSAVKMLGDVDAIFIINCNFGNEEAAGQIAKAVGKPVLLWAPLDDEFAPDGMRYTDSQCGAFGISRQFQRRNIPFSYIETCDVKDPVFDEGIRRFFSVVCMVKNFKGMRIAQVGMRPKPFCSVIVNEGELMQKFDIQIIPINIGVFVDKYEKILQTKKKELVEGAKLFAQQYEVDEQSQPLLEKQYAFVIAYREIMEEYNLQAISAECWTAMQLAVGAMPCSAYSILADEKIIVGCESDLHGTLTMALLAAASLGKKIPFFGEFTVRHPTDPNVQLLWHCGPFAYSLKKKGCQAKMVNQRQWFPVKDGEFTLARFDQDNGKYSLLSGTCESADGPKTFGTYRWVRFKNRSAWERKLIEGPYIHHMAEIEGDYTQEIAEFCKYIPGLAVDTVNEEEKH